MVCEKTVEQKLPPCRQNFKQYIHGLLWLRKDGLMGGGYTFNQMDRDLKEERLEDWWQRHLGNRHGETGQLQWAQSMIICVPWEWSAKDSHCGGKMTLRMSTKPLPQALQCLLNGHKNEVPGNRKWAPQHELPLTNANQPLQNASCPAAATNSAPIQNHGRRTHQPADSRFSSLSSSMMETTVIFLH